MNTKRQDFAILIILTVAGAFLRLYRLGDYGFWRDEAQGIFVSLKAFPVGIIQALIHGGHPPVVFHFLVHFWVPLVGRGELEIRLISAVAGIAVIPVLFWLGREMFDARTGLLAAALGMGLPLHVSVSHEARMYTLLALFTALSMGFLYRAWRDGQRKDWGAYVVFSLLALYTHNWALLVVASQGVWSLFRLLWNREERKGIRSWFVSEVMIVLGYLPWVPVLLKQNQRLVVAGSWLAQGSRVGNLFRIANEMTGLAFSGGRYYLWLLLFFLGAFSLVRDRESLSFRLDMKAAPTLVLACLAGPLLLAVFLTGNGLGVVPSYATMAVYPALCLLLARGVFGLRFRPLMVITVAIIALLWARVLIPEIGQPTSSLREVAAFVEQNSRPGDVIVIAPDYLATTFNYYYQGTQPQVSFPDQPGRRVEEIEWLDYNRRWEHATITPTLQFVQKSLGPGGRVWLIAPLDAYPNDPRFDQIRAIKAAFDRTYVLREADRSFRGPVETADVFLYGRAAK
ncbi:MAG: hypothetical protein GXP41_00785 [Chloroflexi bacterium]|nr:hypothetical protein [Chloroflexota bacterium]